MAGGPAARRRGPGTRRRGRRAGRRPGQLALPRAPRDAASSPRSRPTTTPRPTWAYSASRPSSSRRACRRRSTRSRPRSTDSHCSVRRTTTWTGLARCFALAGRAGSSPWTVARPRSPPPRHWTATPSSTASSRRSPRSDLTTSAPRPRRYLQPDAVSAVLYLPEDEGAELTADALGGAFAVTELRRSERGGCPRTWRRGVSPTKRASTGSREADVLHTSLPGVDLLVRPKAGVPLVHLGIYVPRVQLDPPAQAGIGALTVRSAIRGAGDLDAGALAFAFERLGGTLSPSAMSDWLGFGTSVLADHLVRGGRVCSSWSTPRRGWTSRTWSGSAG